MREAREYPKVGVAVWLKNQKGEVFLMKRKGSHGGGTWAPPGGKLEFAEEVEHCAKRETKEEADLEIGGVKVLGVTNDIFNLETHYITLHTFTDEWKGEPKIMEPEKCSEIGWFELSKLPLPLFLTVENFIKTGQLEKLENA